MAISIGKIPDELLVEILGKLPKKNLLCCSLTDRRSQCLTTASSGVDDWIPKCARISSKNIAEVPG